jgi:hypothetical protein
MKYELTTSFEKVSCEFNRSLFFDYFVTETFNSVLDMTIWNWAMPNTCATNDTNYSKTGFEICPVRNIPDPSKESLGNDEIDEKNPLPNAMVIFE